MHLDFIGWLCNCYKEGSFTEQELEKALKCDLSAYYLLEEFIMNDKTSWGEEVQEELKYFKVNYLDRLKMKRGPNGLG